MYGIQCPFSFLLLNIDLRKAIVFLSKRALLKDSLTLLQPIWDRYGALWISPVHRRRLAVDAGEIHTVEITESGVGRQTWVAVLNQIGSINLRSKKIMINSYI